MLCCFADTLTTEGSSYQPSIPLLQDSIARMEMLSECTNITSTLFSPEEERDESAHDITVDFSLDTSSESQHLTSTPVKTNPGAADHSCDSDTQSQVSVDPPDFSPLSNSSASHLDDSQNHRILRDLRHYQCQKMNRRKNTASSWLVTMLTRRLNPDTCVWTSKENRFTTSTATQQKTDLT